MNNQPSVFIKRIAEAKIYSTLTDKKDRNVILLQGARQVGKSTLLENIVSKIPNSITINLETERPLRQRIDETISFTDFEKVLATLANWNTNTPVLYFDEAQESKQLGTFVREMKEKWTTTKVILSGSSMSRLFRETDRIPVGRFSTFTLGPLTFEEYLTADNQFALLDSISDATQIAKISPVIHQLLLEKLDAFLQIGGLPPVVINALDNKDYFKTLTDIFLAQEEDFLRKTSLSSKFRFKDALASVAKNVGYSSHFNHLAESLSLAKSVSSILSSWHLIHNVEQRGLSSTTNFHPKRYLYDIGVLQLLREMPLPKLSLINTTNPALRTALGGIIENHVLTQMQSHLLGNLHISGWKKSSKDLTEVDFVWRDTNFIVPLECKASLRVTPRSFSSVNQYLNETKERLGIVISLAPFEVFENTAKRVLINLPAYAVNPTIIRGIVSENGF